MAQLRSMLLALFILLYIGSSPAGVKPATTGAYAIDFDVLIAGKPGAVYDGLTGDITGWWDHTFSARPYKLYLEPKPGGGFYEIFNEKGDGAKHATVTYAERGKMIRFEGALGLAGRALVAVTTYKLEAAGADSTKLGLSVHMAGEIDGKTAQAVETVWRHFLVERFKPYFEGKKVR